MIGFELGPTQTCPPADTFDRFNEALARYPAARRCEIEAHAEGAFDDGWRLIGLAARDRADSYSSDPILDYVAQRHQPSMRSTAAMSARAGAVSLSSDDPLKNIEPRVYVEALTGEVVPANGWLCCPLPDHSDTTPSFQVLSSHWRCFGCNRGGSVIDLAAALYGIEPRGAGYWELRDRLIDELAYSTCVTRGEGER